MLALWLTLALLIGCAPDYSPDLLMQPPRDAGRVLDAGRSVDATRPLSDAALELVPAQPDAAADGSVRGCDLSGSWLVTERMVSTVIGADQIIRLWWYLELAQEGDAITVTRSLSCGQRSTGLPPFAIDVDDSSGWPAYLRHPTYEGRLGSSVAQGDTCAVAFDKAVIIRGSTVATYRDLSVPMPTLEQRATATAPGWEDWDEDGKPGISVIIRGTINGSIFITSRTWTQYAGTAPAHARTFKLGLDWEMQRVTLALEGSPLLSTGIAPSPDRSQHFVEFARVTPNTADDSTLCAHLRELAPTLTPSASN